MTDDYQFITYSTSKYTEIEMIERSRKFYLLADSRRSVRNFSEKPFPKEIIENLIRTAGTAPSGANKQPWTFVVVDDPELKRQIRIAAEKEEKIFYEKKISPKWREDLAHLRTNWKKTFLEKAPYIIVVFKQEYGYNEITGMKSKHYYIMESIGIAVGILITAIYNVGLVTLPYTPSPMNFLRNILKRPDNEKPFIILPVGYPADNTMVPDQERKSIEQILVWNIK